METPIEIFNNTHIELTKIVKRKDGYYFPKFYFCIAEIKTIEAARYGDNLKCTKIEFYDSTFIKVTENYKHIRDTHKKWAVCLIIENQNGQ